MAMTRVQIVAPDDWIRRVDEWRRQQPVIPSRSEAIRRLADAGIPQTGHARPAAPRQPRMGLTTATASVIIPDHLDRM